MMPSPHGAFCASPHGAFIKSPHGVRGCLETGAAYYVLTPTFDTPSRTLLTRIDNGTVAWQTDLSDQLGRGPAIGQVRVEYNSHGVYCTMRDSDGRVIVRIDPATGDITAQTRALPLPPPVFPALDNAPPICANRTHVFSLEWDLHDSARPGVFFRKFNPDLSLDQFGLRLIGGIPVLPSFNNKRRINGRVNVITPEGNPRIGPYMIEASIPAQPGISGSFPLPDNGANSVSMGDSVLVATGVEVFSSIVSYHTSGFNSENGEYIGSTANANLGQEALFAPYVSSSDVRACIREHAVGFPAQYVELPRPGGSAVTAIDPFAQITEVVINPAAPLGVTYRPGRVVLWELDLADLLPVDPAATIYATTIRTHQASIRVAGSYTLDGQTTAFAAEIASPDAVPSLTWYTDLGTSPGNYLYDQMQSATAVLGSGEDAPYTPAQ